MGPNSHTDARLLLHRFLHRFGAYENDLSALIGDWRQAERIAVRSSCGGERSGGNRGQEGRVPVSTCPSASHALVTRAAPVQVYALSSSLSLHETLDLRTREAAEGELREILEDEPELERRASSRADRARRSARLSELAPSLGSRNRRPFN